MAMARDGLLPSFFSDVNNKTQVPIKSTIVTGLVAATLSFFMEVAQLAGMVSVGTLLAFTMVAISVLILRYVPPDSMPIPSSLQESIDTVSLRYSTDEIGSSENKPIIILSKEDEIVHPLIPGRAAHIVNENRRKIAGWTIMFTIVGVLLLTSGASSVGLQSFYRFAICAVGGLFLLSGLVVLTCIDQDDARHSFGHTGGFICPFVPLLPITCILINVYLLINLGGDTWTRVSVWLAIGVIVYTFYGRKHSSLRTAIYVPAAHVEEIYRTSEISPA